MRARGRPAPASSAHAAARATCAAAAAILVAACAGVRLSPAQLRMQAAGDCSGLLEATDQARADGDRPLALALAHACPPEKLGALAASSTPVEGLLWCGRASAAVGRFGKPQCDPRTIASLKEALRPRLTLGPSDPSATRDPLLLAALAEQGPDLHLSFAPDPDVIVGKLEVQVDHQTNSTLIALPDRNGLRRQVPATNHRFVARARGQIELGQKTRTLRATAEVRDTTWSEQPRWGIAARAEPIVPPEEELQRRAAAAWLRAAARALWLAPPETVDLADAAGCVAYGLALNAMGGDSNAAASGLGNPASVALCERMLGLPRGAGIPVP